MFFSYDIYQACSIISIFCLLFVHTWKIIILEIDTLQQLGRLLAIFPKGDNFLWNFVYIPVHLAPHEKNGLLNKERICSFSG